MNKRTSTKEKILHILKKDSEISIKELMEYFSISEVAVRRHLNDLLRQGFVKEKIVKQDIGRPFHLYLLTAKGHNTFPNQYEQLPMELLQDLEELQGEEAVKDLLLKRKEREEAEFVSQMENIDFDEKVKRIAEIQQEKGYMIEYEKTASGDYEVKNFNCPIFNLASNYGQICNNEKDIYRNIFPDSKVKAQSCMTKGAKYCCWTITKPKK